MPRTHRILTILALGLALAGGATAAAAAAQPDQAAQRRALYESELRQNLLQREQRAREARPVTAATDVDALPSLLLGLVGGLVGGTAAAIGWTVPTRRRLLRAAAAPEQPQGA